MLSTNYTPGTVLDAGDMMGNRVTALTCMTFQQAGSQTATPGLHSFSTIQTQTLLQSKGHKPILQEISSSSFKLNTVHRLRAQNLESRYANPNPGSAFLDERP